MEEPLDINLFYLTFTLYFAGMLAFILYAALPRILLHQLGIGLMIAGAVAHITAFLVRWQLARHIPLSNMYEYISLMGWTSVVVLIFLYFRYNRPVLGTFITPVVFMLMVTAALLPKDVNQSLMPALQSVWLNIHVSLAALGAGCFLVSFAASALYLISRYETKSVNSLIASKLRMQMIIAMLFIPFGIMVMAQIAGLIPPAPDSILKLSARGLRLGSTFILLGLGFFGGALLLPLYWLKHNREHTGGLGGWLFIAVTVTFTCGALVEGLLINSGVLQLTHSFISMRSGETVKSAWLFFEFFGCAYILSVILSPLVFLLLGRMSAKLTDSRLLPLDLLDEINYKSVSLGYPLYTVGALFAGAIWAEQAWGAFWSWDPKEVGALIIWLFYSGYLHARYQRGWTGSRAAILAVSGFILVLVSFLGNYFFGGLHAYT